MELPALLEDVAEALVAIDQSGVPFKQFLPGVGPYGEPQLLRAVAARLNALPKFAGSVRTKRTPDMLIPGQWALEFKLARPFGDNGREAEDWSVNLLHPYAGNVSVIGDCIKLQSLDCEERRAAVVIGYTHDPPRVDLAPLLRAFEVVAEQVAGLRLSPRAQTERSQLRHPVHQRLVIAAWEVLPRAV